MTHARLRNIIQALQAAGFSQVASYGDMTGAAFNPSSSGNLVVTARRSGM